MIKGLYNFIASSSFYRWGSVIGFGLGVWALVVGEWTSATVAMLLSMVCSCKADIIELKARESINVTVKDAGGNVVAEGSFDADGKRIS